MKYVPSIDRDDDSGVGGTGTQSSHYWILNRVFSHVTLRPTDTVLDVGCGKGRVLAFFLKKKVPSRLFGIEHNEEVGRIAAEWTARYEQVQVFIGDALTLDYEPYTVLTLARPFLPVTFMTFVEQLERTVTHPVTLVVWYDLQSKKLLKDRPGWAMQTSGMITRIHGLRVAYWPQGYSIWTYDPGKRETP